MYKLYMGHIHTLVFTREWIAMLLRTLHHNLIELGHFFAAIALQLISYFTKYPVLLRIKITTLLKYKVN